MAKKKDIPEGAKVKANPGYRALKKEAKKPGIQPSEHLAIKKMQAKPKNEGMTKKQALKRIASRTRRGVSVAGMKAGVIYGPDKEHLGQIGIKEGYKPKRKRKRS